jgi:hypothetical protein
MGLRFNTGIQVLQGVPIVPAVQQLRSVPGLSAVQKPALSPIEGFNRFAPFNAFRRFKVQLLDPVPNDPIVPDVQPLCSVQGGAGSTSRF